MIEMDFIQTNHNCTGLNITIYKWFISRYDIAIKLMIALDLKLMLA